jgi:hypothetical protein
MSLEIRMIDSDGTPVRTAEDVTIPSLRSPAAPGTMMLADYCFNEEGPWIKPQQMITVKDVAAVVYSRHGRKESMVVSERKLHDEEQMGLALNHLWDCLLTRYPGKEGKEVFMFYLPPYVKKRLRGILK